MAMVQSISWGSKASYGVPAGKLPSSRSRLPVTLVCMECTVASTRSASGHCRSRITVAPARNPASRLLPKA